MKFEKEKETKNKVRYQEQTEGDSEPCIGTLYVSKEFVKELDNPQCLEVEVKAA